MFGCIRKTLAYVFITRILLSALSLHLSLRCGLDVLEVAGILRGRNNHLYMLSLLVCF